MTSCKIKNVIFDIGNVIVRWSPVEIIRLTFGESEQPEICAKSIFQSEIWSELNKGLISEHEAQIRFQDELGFSEESMIQLFYYIKRTQILLFGSIELLTRVKNAGYKVYALTDNVTEIVDYLKSTYDFWHLFNGTIVSSEVRCLKPNSEIFVHLLEQYELNASESVFIDDMLYNVQGAELLGFSGIEFKNSVQCEQELQKFGLSF